MSHCQYCGEELVVDGIELDCPHGCLTPCFCDAISEPHDAGECENSEAQP